MRDDGVRKVKSGIMDARKIYPRKLKDIHRSRPWTERVLRGAMMQSPDLHGALAAALKARNNPFAHDVGDESVFWAHLENRLEDSEAASMVKMVRGDGRVEAFRQHNNRFDPHFALTKSHGLMAIQKCSENHTVKKNVDVPSVMARIRSVVRRPQDRGFQRVDCRSS